jgi:hypothetical protein
VPIVRSAAGNEIKDRRRQYGNRKVRSWGEDKKKRTSPDVAKNVDFAYVIEGEVTYIH